MRKETCPRSPSWWQSGTGLVCEGPGSVSLTPLLCQDGCCWYVQSEHAPTTAHRGPRWRNQCPLEGQLFCGQESKGCVLGPALASKSSQGSFKEHNASETQADNSNFYCFCTYFLFIERVQNALPISDTKIESMQCPPQPINSQAQRPQKPWIQQILTLPSLLKSCEWTSCVIRG